MLLRSQIRSSTALTGPRLFFGRLALTVVAMESAAAQDNIVIQWNNIALQTIRYRHPGPTINARALAIAHTCTFDAWAAYDDKAVATQMGDTLRRPLVERTEENKKKAISFAAYRCLADLFPSDVARYQALMAELGFNPTDTRIDAKTPSGIGNLAASSVLRFRHHDGSNQLGDLHPGAYTDYTGYTPANDPDYIKDVDRWQPLRTPVPDGGLYGRFLVQTFTTPQWGLVTPFCDGVGVAISAEKEASVFCPA